ncbi:hypothetical protein [Streptomyces sp. NPDC048349]|uniref:hypothetical protein n=1 Tax=Streptomyces sp. NPDC048349 TaxID=3155486 RepID=UPI0034359529
MNESAGVDAVRATIDQGLPVNKEEWPTGTLENLREFTQGCLIQDPPFFYFADPENPVWMRTRAYSGRGYGPEVIEGSGATLPMYGIVTTQTCDIAEEDAPRPKRPWVQISPVYDMSGCLDNGQKKQLQRFDGNAYFLHLPSIPNGFWVADFRIEVPVEKGWLAARTPVDGFLDESLQRKVGQRLAALRSRPAFAGSFVSAVQAPLVDSLRALKKSNKALHTEIMASVREIRVGLDSHLAPKQARVILLTEDKLTDAVWEWWLDWWDSAAEEATRLDFTLLPMEQKTTSEMSVKEYKEMTELPTDRVSPAG